MSTSNSHDLTKTIGDCGLFQIRISTAIYFAYSTAVWGLLFMIFGLYNPGWICLDDGPFNTSDFANETAMHHTPSTLYLHKSENIPEWSKDCAVKTNCQHLMYNPESSTVVTEWDLTCDSSWIPSIIISVQMSGVIAGSSIIGQIGDKFGRKLSVYGSVAIHGISQLSASFVNTWQLYAVAMFFIGMGGGGTLASSFHYPLEFLTSWWRGVLPSIPVWNIGCTAFVLMAFISKDWRYVHISGAAVSALVLITAFWIPESIRWLAVSGKGSKAKDVVAKIARINKRPCPDTQIIDDIANEEKSKMGCYKYGYLDLFRIKAIRANSIKFGLIWFVMAISYYIISFGIKSLSGSFYLNMFIFVALDFPAVLLVAPSVNKLGRRKACLMFFGLASAFSFSVVVVIFASSSGVKEIAILVLALLCKTVIMGAWYAVKLYSSELFPTVVRSLHYGYVNSVARLGGILSPYILSNDPNTLYVPFLAIGLLTLFICGVICTLSETKGKSLQDRAECETIEIEPLQDKSDQTS